MIILKFVFVVLLLQSNGTHFIYENTIQGDVDPHEGLISREKSIRLHFFCEYPLSQALSMDVGINPIERCQSDHHLAFMAQKIDSSCGLSGLNTLYIVAPQHCQQEASIWPGSLQFEDHPL